MFDFFCNLFPFFLELYYPFPDSSPSSNLDRSYSNKSQSVNVAIFVHHHFLFGSVDSRASFFFSPSRWPCWREVFFS